MCAVFTISISMCIYLFISMHLRVFGNGFGYFEYSEGQNSVENV